MTKSILSVAAFTALALTASADEGPLKSEMSAWLVTETDEGEEVLNQVEDVPPGAIVEYQLTYQNIGDEPLSGLVVSVPVPEAMDLEMDTARTAVDAMFESTIDNGETWSAPPIEVSDGVVADAGDYDLVRWTTADAIAPGETWAFAYRVVVE